MDELCNSCRAEHDLLTAETAWENYLIATAEAKARATAEGRAA
jgi:hypothetical protein